MITNLPIFPRRHLLHPLFVTVVVATATVAMAASQLSQIPEVKEMAAANTRFTLDLLRKCGAEQKGKNIFLGPFSITTALAMTQIGAAGQTATEMSSVLQWQTPGGPLKGFGSYMPLLQKDSKGDGKGYILVGAQRVYVDKRVTLKQKYLGDVQTHFASDAKMVDFKGNPDQERSNINNWVDESTRGKIKDLLPSGSINPMTAMVLVQATYFKGSWKNKFEESNTKPAPFYAPQGEIKVNMMEQTKNFNYGFNSTLGCRAIEMPYASNSSDSSGAYDDLSMLVLLPEARDGLDKLEAALTFDQLHNLRSQMRSQKVKLQFPRFKMESSFELKNILSNLGMPTAFSEKADFTNMAEGEDAKLLYISQVFHKAILEVNEEGSEAAAATAIRMTRSIPIIEDFNADHPFIVFIIDNRADVILFMGHVTSPPAAATAELGANQEL